MRLEFDGEDLAAFETGLADLVHVGAETYCMSAVVFMRGRPIEISYWRRGWTPETGPDAPAPKWKAQTPMDMPGDQDAAEMTGYGPTATLAVADCIAGLQAYLKGDTVKTV